MLALAALPIASCGEPVTPSTGPANVFLITVDTLRADHLGTYGYPRPTSPRLDALAESAVVFDIAIAQWPLTGPSFASIFTGQYPLTTSLTHRAALRLPDDYLTLPELMRDRGYRTLAVNSNAVLAADLGWDQGFDEFVELWKRGEGDATDDPVEYRRRTHAARVNDVALRLLERHRDEERLFAWIHYSDPHWPYLLPRGVDNPFLDDGLCAESGKPPLSRPKITAMRGHHDLCHYVAAYDANVALTDRAVGDLLDRARALDMLDDSLVVFTSDHGESLGEHDAYFTHGRLPYNETARVPLIIARNGISAISGRVEMPVELLDLYPTLRDLVASGQEIPGLEGKTLLPLLERSPAELDEGQAAAFRFAISQAGGDQPLTHFRSIQNRRWKLVYHPRAQRQGVALYLLFDLEADPGEIDNVVLRHRDLAFELRRVLFRWMGDRRWVAPTRELQELNSAETRAALKALGYL